MHFKKLTTCAATDSPGVTKPHIDAGWWHSGHFMMLDKTTKALYFLGDFGLASLSPKISKCLCFVY